MADRTSRLWVAVLLTVMDIAVFKRFADVIWLASARLRWIQWTLFLTLAVWIGSAAVLWLRVYYDFRHLLPWLHSLPDQDPSPSLPNSGRPTNV